MAKVGWSAGIDYVSGALSKPSKNGQHSCQKMLLGTHRTAATTSNNCNRLYLRPKIERSTPPTVNGQSRQPSRLVRRTSPRWMPIRQRSSLRRTPQVASAP